LDQDAALKALRDAGYDGCISVEYEGEESGSTAVPRAVNYRRQVIGV
jgi:sugar phosphate isomerase/epimerase